MPRFPMLAYAALSWTACACQGSDETTLSVFCAASLTDAFAELERDFEAENDGVDVVVTTAGSQVLRLQIEQGAAADVFASADARHVDALIEAGLVRESHVFAENELAVIVPPGDPAGVGSFSGLSRARHLVVGSDSVPVGAYTRALLARAAERLGEGFAAAVRDRVASEESNVRLVRAKVELGEADAAIVYRTDAVTSQRVQRLDIPPELNVRTTYYAALLADRPRPGLARRWVALLRSDRGKRVLSRLGFVPAS